MDKKLIAIICFFNPQIEQTSLLSLLPPDSHLALSGRLHVSLTNLSNRPFTNTIVSHFPTRFKGAFLRVIKSKPHKYNIKLFWRNDDV